MYSSQNIEVETVTMRPTVGIDASFALIWLLYFAQIWLLATGIGLLLS